MAAPIKMRTYQLQFSFGPAVISACYITQHEIANVFPHTLGNACTAAGFVKVERV